MNATSTIFRVVNDFSSGATVLATATSHTVGKTAKIGAVFNPFKFNWGQSALELFILIALVSLVFFYFFFSGRYRLTMTIVSTYLALAVVNTLPYLDRLSFYLAKTGIHLLQTTIFLVVFLILFLLLSRRSLLSDTSRFYGGFLQIFLFSILQTGLFASIVLSFLPYGIITKLSGFSQFLFISDLGKFSWIFLPIIALILIRR